MKSLVPAIGVIVAVLAWPLRAQTQICEIGGECRTFNKPEDAGQYAQAQQDARNKKSQTIELAMPIDYRDCIAVALLDEMKPDRALHYFIDDMDASLQSKLRQRGIRALPGSALPEKWFDIQNHTKHTPYWHFYFAFTGVMKAGKEYQAAVGFHCGTLCSSETAYVLKVAGPACEIVSKNWLGGA